jgi:hypothetical protein
MQVSVSRRNGIAVESSEFSTLFDLPLRRSLEIFGNAGERIDIAFGPSVSGLENHRATLTVYQDGVTFETEFLGEPYCLTSSRPEHAGGLSLHR